MPVHTHSLAFDLAVAARRDIEKTVACLRAAAETPWVSPSADAYRRELWETLRRVHRLSEDANRALAQLAALDESPGAGWS